MVKEPALSSEGRRLDPARGYATFVGLFMITGVKQIASLDENECLYKFI